MDKINVQVTNNQWVDIEHINDKDENGNTLLHRAAEEGDASCIQNLLNAHAITNPKNHNHETPLHYASHEGQVKAIELLLEKNPKAINARTRDQYTPLMYAVEKGSLEAVNALIKAKANVNARGPSGTTALHMASMYQLKEIAARLLQVGARADFKDRAGGTPADWAEGHEEMMKLFEEYAKLHPSKR